MRDDTLFTKGDLHTWLGERTSHALQEVESLGQEQIVSGDTDALVGAFVARYSVEDIQLRAEDVEADEPSETTMEVNDWGERQHVRAMLTRLHVPFSGDPDLFHLQGSSFTSMHPRATVESGHLVFSFVQREPNPEELKTRLNQQLGLVRQYLQGVTPMVSEFNARLAGRIRQRIEERKEKVVAGKKALAATGFKVRARPDAATFAPPVVRKRAVPTAPASPKPLKSPDPTLDDAIYEEILRVIGHAMLTAERSPSVFVGMGEEDIRQIILLFLNAVFEGEAVGEAFNCAGKTDILIRHKGGNLFIAECKFWNGPKSLSDAIDQLLSYTTWRDTKTAVVLLNRDVEFSTVLEKVPNVLRQHGAFVRDAAVEGLGRFRAVLSRPADAESHVVVTVLAFDLPRKS